MHRDLESAAIRVGVLSDELRRRMYEFIRTTGRPVSRDEAAAQVGISHKLAAFHLDKLVDHGLLKAHYARLPGRSGPGAGRSSKLYEPSDVEIEVSIPPRRYDVVGRILVEAVESGRQDESPRDTVRRVARRFGVELGEQFRRERRLRPPGPERALAIAERILARHGFEPYRDDQGQVALRNCPFRDLARTAPDLVCGLNQALLDGLLRGLGNQSVEALLEPKPGQCCVSLRGR
ncbi:MAG: helix-turn-helix transcriptional regulator [Egibacteraceae bacterium]